MNQPAWDTSVDSVPIIVSPIYIADSDTDGEDCISMDQIGSRTSCDFLPDRVMMEVEHASLENTSQQVGPSEENHTNDSDEFEEDMTPEGRYFLNAGEGNISSSQRCFNCGLPGHQSRECPSKSTQPCYLCGGRDHQRSNCLEDVCFNCGGVGHISRKCKEPRRPRAAPDQACNRCGLPGHFYRDCTLNWRRYHFCVDLNHDSVSRARYSIKRCCYFCSSPTHLGDECPQRTPYNTPSSEWSIFHRPQLEFLVKTAFDTSSVFSDHRNNHKSGKHGGSKHGGNQKDFSRREHLEKDLDARRRLEYRERALGHHQEAIHDFSRSYHKTKDTGISQASKLHKGLHPSANRAVGRDESFKNGTSTKSNNSGEKIGSHSRALEKKVFIPVSSPEVTASANQNSDGGKKNYTRKDVGGTNRGSSSKPSDKFRYRKSE